MSFVKYPPETTSEAIAVFKQDVPLLHEIVHGDSASETLTEGGLIPSVNNVIQDILTRVGEGTAADIMLRDNLAAQGSDVLVGGVEAGNIANALRNTVTIDEDDESPDAIQTAINYCSSVGGGTVLLGAKTYNITEPILLKGFVNLVGQGQTTIIRKAVSSSIGGVDAILLSQESSPINQFFVKDLTLVGNRTNAASGNVVTTNGVHLTGAHFFSMKNVKVEDCLVGFTFSLCYVAELERLRAFRCQSYGFATRAGCTTLSASNLLSWACGGGYSIHSTIYSTFRDCACDYADYGGVVGDPFLPEGSGGNHLNPAYVWEIVASRITVVGAGAENCRSKWLYGEGAFVNFSAPFAFNLRGDATTYRAIELRGTGKSNVNITNATFDIGITGFPSTQRRMYFLDSPRNQTISMDTVILGDTSFGDFANPVDGVEFNNSTKLLDYTQESMNVGETRYPLIFEPTDIEPTITLVGATKRFNVINKTATYQIMRLPINYVGSIEILADGSHTSSFDVFQIRVAGFDGVDTDIISTISYSGVFNKRDYIDLGGGTVLTSKPLYIELISPNSADVTYFDNLKISRIK